MREVEVFDLKDANGRVFAFEVHAFNRRAAKRLVRAIPNAALRAFHGFGEVFCEFEVDGVQFQIWEPYNDNSRYWIGPEPARWVPQLEGVRAVFARARDFWFFVWLPERR